jgi:hypothetical protein
LITVFENNIGLITFLTFAALLWYAWETRRLVNKTNKSVILTEEKEKIDRAIDFMDRYNGEEIKKYINEIDNESYELGIVDGTVIDIYDSRVNEKFRKIIDYFDLISYLTNSVGKVDYNLIQNFFGDKMVMFVWNNQYSIEKLIKLYEKTKRTINYKNYFLFCLKIVKDKNLFSDDQGFLKWLDKYSK